MVDIDAEAVAEQAVREGWSWGRVAEELAGAVPGLDAVRALATLERVAHQSVRRGPLGAAREAVRGALAGANRAA